MTTDTVQLHDTQLNWANAQTNDVKPGRLLSLDGLRGFDMFWIIGGQGIFIGLAKVWPGRFSTAVVQQLHHVPWEGLHCFDVIWPLFMFMVGVSLPFSVSKRKSNGATNKDLHLHALRRALILFVLGMMAQGNLLQFNLATLHPLLQRSARYCRRLSYRDNCYIELQAEGASNNNSSFLDSVLDITHHHPSSGCRTGRIDPLRECSNLR